jgi:DNA-directed RNA polymerase subunit RPC12/RpoP
MDYRIIRALFTYYGPYEYFDVFGVPTIFWKISRKIDRAKELVCPRCGKKGVLMWKTTISKKIYKYRKLYVYHERIPFSHKTSIRIQKWCYLNKNQLKNPSIQNTIKATRRARDIERYFFECISLHFQELLK